MGPCGENSEFLDLKHDLVGKVGAGLGSWSGVVGLCRGGSGGRAGGGVHAGGCRPARSAGRVQHEMRSHQAGHGGPGHLHADGRTTWRPGGSGRFRRGTGAAPEDLCRCHLRRFDPVGQYAFERIGVQPPVAGQLHLVSDQRPLRGARANGRPGRSCRRTPRPEPGTRRPSPSSRAFRTSTPRTRPSVSSSRTPSPRSGRSRCCSSSRSRRTTV